MHRPSSRQLRAHRRRRLPSISRGDTWWNLLLCLEHALLLGGLSEAPASENPRAKGRTRRPSIMFWGGDDSGRNEDCHLGLISRNDPPASARCATRDGGTIGPNRPPHLNHGLGSNPAFRLP